MAMFFRFPSTPHLAWLGHGSIPRDDKLLSKEDARDLIADEVVVEEKLDGANIGLSLTNDGALQIQNRGQYLITPHVGQFARLPDWIAQHGEQLCHFINPNLILFGEWCAARHSVGYDRLPDWFLLFDVYDLKETKFWSTTRRNVLAAQVGLSTVPTLLKGTTDLSKLAHLLTVGSSCYRIGSMEGLIIRRETAKWCDSRAKLVRDDFIQTIDEHWSRRRIEWNRIDWSNQ
ncbi:DNA ligase [Azospirillum melinis]|uniref:DNA ligase n=1 Tax=Azospirillum melinis TaxID=328839 RepID=A0ABX2KSP1_9PROT|nr:DNA ligase [Azospirillum melinis]